MLQKQQAEYFSSDGDGSGSGSTSNGKDSSRAAVWCICWSFRGLLL